MKARNLLALSLVAVAIGILFPPLSLFAAPPLPDDPGAGLRLDARDVLNPEFPSVPAEDLHPLPAPAVAFDDAMARTIVWAGAPGLASSNAFPRPPELPMVEEPSLAKRLWPDGIDWKRTITWVGGIVSTAVAGWYAIARVDYHEGDASPAPAKPSTLSPAALAAAAQQAPQGGGSSEVLNLAISGTFLGPVQVTERGQWTPGLAFVQGVPGRAGEISAFLSSDGTNRQGGGTWRATYGNEIAIAVPDGAYAGLATVQGANIVLASGVVLRPQSGASAAFVRP